MLAKAAHLLFPDNTVAPLFKKGAGGNGGMGNHSGGALAAGVLLQGLGQLGGNALALVVLMDIEPVQIAGRIHIRKAGNNAVFLRN